MKKIIPLKKKAHKPLRKAEKPFKKAQAKKKKIRQKPESFLGLHNLIAPKGAHKRKKILGRGPGSGHGKTSTRGSKGQTSRSGRDFYAGFEGGQSPLIRRIPKRGFTSKFKKEYQIVNLDDLKTIKDTLVNLELLKKKGLIKDKAKPVKILAKGEIKNALTVQAHAFSKQASEKIQKAGGKIEVVNA